MAFLNLPPLPATVSADLRGKLETYRVEYFADEEPRYQVAFAIADELVAFRPGGTADLAAKLMVALHELAPGDQHETLLQIDPMDIQSGRAERLLIACVDDAIRLAAVSEWDRNLLAYRTAHATLQQTLDLLSVAERQSSRGNPLLAAIEEHNNVAIGAEFAAETRLLATPAPDLAAVLIKGKILQDIHQHPDGMKALCEDMTRLASASITEAKQS